MESKLTEVINQTGLDVFTFRASEVKVPNVAPLALYFFESPNLIGQSLYEQMKDRVDEKFNPPALQSRSCCSLGCRCARTS